MEVTVEYETPICCMRRLTRDDTSDEFIFHLKFKKSTQQIKEIKIQTTINKARIISKKVNEIIQIDPTLNEYEIDINIEQFSETNSKETDETYFNSITKIFEDLLKSTEEKIQLQEKEEKNLSKIRFLLGDTKEDEVRIEMTNIQESISYLRTSQHDFSICFLSSHICELIENGEFFKLDEKIANEIIDSYFQQNDKDDTNDEEIQKIFSEIKEQENESIVMHFLLQIEIEKYTKEMKEYILDHLSDEIVYNELGQIIRQYRFQLQNAEAKETASNKGKTSVEFKGDELNGIISHMKKINGDNLIENGNLVISSGHRTYSGSLNNMIKYDGESINEYFRNNDGSPLKESEGWIEFDFIKQKINLTSYTLRTSSDSSCYHPKTWRVLGSNDRTNWDVLNKQANNSSLNGRYNQHRFECEPNQNYYRYIRYIQDDSWCSDRQYCIFLTCVEFFGSISTE